MMSSRGAQMLGGKRSCACAIYRDEIHGWEFWFSMEVEVGVVLVVKKRRHGGDEKSK